MFEPKTYTSPLTTTTHKVRDVTAGMFNAIKNDPVFKDKPHAEIHSKVRQVYLLFFH